MTTPALRVALVSEHASPLAPVGHPETGGQNVYVDALARELGRLGCHVDVYTRRASAADLPTVSVTPNVTVHHVRAGPPEPIARDELMPLMPEFADGLAAAWAAAPPDVVHAHFWMSGWAAVTAADGVVPVVQTFHALGSVKRRHQGAADTSPPERAATERRLLHAVDTIVATCRDEVAELQQMGRRAADIRVVPCGVSNSFSPFGPVDPSPRRRPHRLVSVSRLVPRKGLADAFHALAAVRHDAELLVVGGGDGPVDDPGEAALRALAADLGIADRVTFRGRLAGPQVAAVMRSADAVVCAPWYEPFGIVPVEAMACGVPVIGTAVGGLLDTVRDGVTGVLVPPRAPDALAEAIDRLLADPMRRRRMGAAGAARGATYRWPRIASSLLDVYHRTIARRADARTEAVLA
jgi:glycosyltransferase involved in cell wall biosynthesis